MRESRTYGSVRGALSNERPYRDRALRAVPTIRPRPSIMVGTARRAPLPTLRTCDILTRRANHLSDYQKSSGLSSPARKNILKILVAH